MLTAKKADKKQHSLKSHWSDESELTQSIIIAILERLERSKALLYQIGKQLVLIKKSLRKSKRPPTEFQRFFGKKMKEGLAPREIGKL